MQLASLVLLLQLPLRGGRGIGRNVGTGSVCSGWVFAIVLSALTLNCVVNIESHE